MKSLRGPRRKNEMRSQNRAGKSLIQGFSCVSAMGGGRKGGEINFIQKHRPTQ